MTTCYAVPQPFFHTLMKPSRIRVLFYIPRLFSPQAVLWTFVEQNDKLLKRLGSIFSEAMPMDRLKQENLATDEARMRFAHTDKNVKEEFSTDDADDADFRDDPESRVALHD